MLEVKNLCKEFKDKKNIKKAVDNISFKLEKGEIVGLLGENGAGKTTTMRMISTMLKPTSGTITVNGFDAVKNPADVRRNIGILFGGDVGIYDRLTARENIRYFAELNDVKKDEIEERINTLAKELEMEEYIDKRVGKFSRGMKQKVSIARSIIHYPEVMLFDEPTTGLDVTAARTVHDFIEGCKKQGKTILLSSHSMKEVEKLCDRVIIIHKGKFIEQGTISGLKEKYNNDDLEEVFVQLINGGVK